MPDLADRFDALADRIVLGLAPRPDEHVLVSGGAHQFGENRMYGGLNNAPLHWDLVMLEPTLEVAGRTLLSRGRFAEDQLEA